MDSDIHPTTDVCDTRLSLALAGGDVEAEKVTSPARPSTDEEEGSPRKKLRLSNHQSAHLEDTFKLHSTLTPSQKQALANQLNLRPRQVEVWFQNRRARTKVKQTETECEMMKKRWEQLADDNKRLHYELYHLKLVSVICPSCNKFVNSSLNN